MLKIKLFECPQCKRVFKKKYNMLRHIKGLHKKHSTLITRKELTVNTRFWGGKFVKTINACVQTDISSSSLLKFEKELLEVRRSNRICEKENEEWRKFHMLIGGV